MNPKDSLSEHMLHLDPSAAIPFAHDGPGSHTSKLDDLRSAVVDSGAEYVHGAIPWNEYLGDERIEEDYQIPTMLSFTYQHKMSLPSTPSFGLTDYIYEVSPSPVPRRTHVMGNVAIKSNQAELNGEQDTIHGWIKENIVNEYDKDAGDWVWKLREGSHVFLRAHRQEIMEAIPEQLKYNVATEDISRIIKMVAQGETFGNEYAGRMIQEDPYFLTDNPELFPDFKFDMDYVHKMLDANRSHALMLGWRCIEEDCLQETVDLVQKGDRVSVFNVIGELAEKVHISREFLVAMAERDPHGLLRMVQLGQLPEVKKDKELIQQLHSILSDSELIDMGVLDELTIPELNQLLQFRSYKARMFARLRQVGRIETLDEAIEAIEAFGAESIIGEVSILPREIQSYIFQSMATGSGTDWIGYLGQFKRLSDDDYIFILDSMPLIEEKLLQIDSIANLFRNANSRLIKEYESLYKPIRDRRLHEKQQQKEMNEHRKHQSQAERTYFEAGNVSVETHDYHEPLDADAIIEALEHNGCVRMAGDIQEIATDTSRGNLMMCIAGSKEQLSTSELGAGADANARQTVTEHEALQDFTKFIRDLPNNYQGYRDSLGTELTYIGEREYSEAVEGIALYWKWFLDQDPESQLYIGAVVSHGSTIKSDIYMLDRVLGHFSDEDMAKYKGRLLTGKDKVTQEDPEKVKAVLIDDWTISGAQLRNAYATFTQDYPHLAKSIEIQLIAASKERVALGIEDVSGRYLNEGMRERSVPTKVRAYFVAHLANSADQDARYARITGSHSSVDYGFTIDIARAKESEVAMPLIAAVVRPYRQGGYTIANIERLQQVNEGLSNVA